MKTGFRIKALWPIVAASALLAIGCGRQHVDPEAEYELVVLHTNDHHGSVLTRKDAAGVGHGGLAERATFIAEVRAQHKNVLLVDAGDINTGTAVSNMFAAEPDIAAYNEMGYEVATFGNHEFDGPLAKLHKQMKLSKFPWLSVNIKQGNKYLGKPYVIKKYDGFTVGIFGLTTNRTQVIASPDASLTFIDEIEAARAMVAELRGKVDVLIALTHIGDVTEAADHNSSVKLAEAVPGIDLIIDGHSHSYFSEAKYVNDTPIVTANEWGKYVGEAVFRIKNKTVVQFSWRPVEITDAVYPPDARVTAVLQPYIDEAEASLKKVMMVTSDEFPFGNRITRYQETASGDLLCDATVAQLKTIGMDVDFAIQNGGNIRTALPKGAVTKEAIMTMLPFENVIYVLTLRGSDVRALFDFIGSINQGAGGFAQVSREARYTITYDAEGRNGRISDVTVGGIPIDDEKTYRVATNDYLAGGGDGYVVFGNALDTFNSSMLLSDVFIDYVQSLPSPVAPETDGRIRIVGGVTP